MIQTQRVLIVDDDPGLSRMLGIILHKAGYKVFNAANGQEGLEKAEQVNPHLVLLDVMMPDMSGIEVCRRLRSKPSTREIAVIMLSALGQSDDKVKGFEVGADDYLSKPVNAAELVARVKALLNRASMSRPSSAYTIGMMGVKGGVGITTTAVNVALSLANQGHSVIYFECRANGGEVKYHLKLEAESDFGHLLSHDPLQIFHPEIIRCLVTHSSGLQLFMAPEVNHKQPLTVGHIEKFFDVFSSRADYIIIDLPAIADQTAWRTLELSDQILLFTEPNLLSTYCAKRHIDLVRSWGILERANLVMIHRAQSSTNMNWVEVENRAGVGTKSQTKTSVPSWRKGVEKVEEKRRPGQVVGIIPYGNEDLVEAIHHKVPLILTDPNARTAQAYISLVNWLQDEDKYIDLGQFQIIF